MIKRLTLFLITSCLVLSAYGQTRYVMDELLVNLRSGQGDQYRIIKILPSGTSMKVLSGKDDDEWIQVETSAGDKGWIRSQYLQSTPVAQILLTQAQKRLATLEEQNQKLTPQSQALQSENLQLKSQLDSTQSRSSNLDQELEEIKRVSANAVTLNNNNKKLMEERQILETEIDVLKAENERLSDDSNQTWFMYGAIAVVIGMLMTLIIQKIRSRRRYSEWG